MKLSTSCWLASLAVLPAFTAADWQYRSRPDLAPPRLNITTSAAREQVEQGLLFVAPYPGAGPDARNPVQPAAYIFRDNGDLVWSGLGYFAGGVANFGVDTWDGRQVLHAFQGQRGETEGRSYGHHVILNSKYEPVKLVRGRSNRLGSAHEFRIVDDDFALVEIGSTRPVGLSPWGGAKGQDWILSTGFQELNIETGEVVFQWESLDHVDPGNSAFPLAELPSTTGLDSSSAWDYFHINSVDKDSQGNYIISARATSAIYKVNGTSGEVIWTLGGANSTFDMEPEAHFAYQHDARLLSRSPDGTTDVLSLFDNAAASPEKQISSVSRARIVQLNHSDNTAKALRTYPAPDGLSAQSQGNAQVLPNGNVFVNWGQAGAITEFGEDGRVLFHAYLDSGPGGSLVQNYRGFRSNWTGSPSEDPALVVVEGDARGKVEAYVSWNGDTEVVTWRFYAEPSPDRSPSLGEGRLVLGEAGRTGFETHLTLDVSRFRGEVLISAQAVDAKDRILVHTSSEAISRNPWGSPGLFRDPLSSEEHVATEEL
ncbi:Putative quinoprotein alcohol dehydrogenase-like superfamily [Colletotrichum destructivum]|uniref:Quinoprotein alcohol dehydrogenase-like superfamily n=1 Tax=Colletotrichum destructivum TaxID=34406 RepID=A0AAX4I6X6_9PEZI|nr:Putative quinoprotein alcohol dehydrogenase-like superfamily [Colletotrichum destructivum]